MSLKSNQLLVYILRLSWRSIFWTLSPWLFCLCCAWILGVLFFIAGELCTIFISYKFNFKAFNSFFWVWSSWSCTYVLMFLYFYESCLYCGCLAVLHVLFLVVHVMLVAPYLIFLFYFFIIFNCDVGLVNFLSVATSSSNPLWLSE